MSDNIVNDRIAGTRITVWDIVHYLEANRTANEIAAILNISTEQVESAIEFIDNDRERIYKIHEKIQARIDRGNPPEVKAKLAGVRQRMERWLNERNQTTQKES